MAEFLLNLASALPCLALIHWLRQSGRDNPRLLYKLFAIGLAAPLAAGTAELLSIPLCGLLPVKIIVPAKAFIGIALVEELIKFGAMILVVQRNSCSTVGGAAYGMCTAMGFAISESIIYLIGADSPLQLALLRGFTATPLHVLTGGIMGMAWARVRIESRGSIGVALLLATGIHGAYNFISMDNRLPAFLRIVVSIVGWTGLLISLHRLNQAETTAKNDDFSILQKRT